MKMWILNSLHFYIYQIMCCVKEFTRNKSETDCDKYKTPTNHKIDHIDILAVSISKQL